MDEQNEHRLTERQEDLVNAAIRLVDTVGIEGFTMRSLAKEIGLSPMAAYKHFANQRVLQLEVWRTLMGELGGELQKAAGGSLKDGALAAFLAMCRHFIDYAVSQPKRFELLFHHNFISESWKEADIDELNKGVWEGAANVLAMGQKDGTVRSDVPARELFVSAYSQLVGAGYLLVTERIQHRSNLEESEAITRTMAVVHEMLVGR